MTIGIKSAPWPPTTPAAPRSGTNVLQDRLGPDIRAEIDKHVAQLEERSGRITAGRVVVKAPSGHHRTGGLYEITIHLSLPEGREVNIGRTPQNDERYADIDYALSDAFKRARRQLQDEVRKCRAK